MNNGQRFHRHLVALKRAYRSLAEFGPTKERRQRALGALRALRGEVDRYKVPVKRKKPRRLKSFEGRRARLLRAGWREVTDSAAAAFAAAGVTVRRVRAPGLAQLRGDQSIEGTPEAFLVPIWAYEIGCDDLVSLRKAKGNAHEQRYQRAKRALEVT